MLLSGSILKTILKRDNIIVGGEANTRCVTIPTFDVESCTKPGLFVLHPWAKLNANVYGMLVAINPQLLEACEVSGPQLIPPHATELPSIYVRPAVKGFDFEKVEYLYQLYVIDGRMK